MRDIRIKGLEIPDFATGSPRQVLKMAFQNGIIDDDRWMDMLSTL